MVSYPAPSYSSLDQWAQRLYKAHMNLVENLTPFAILVIITHLTGVSNEMTAIGARMFFWSRLAQIILHTLGVSWADINLYHWLGWEYYYFSPVNCLK